MPRSGHSQRRQSLSERVCRFFSRMAAALVCITGVAVLMGWMANLPFLKGGFWSGITVKTNAGVGLLLIGAALGISQFPIATRWATIVVRLMAAVAALLGGLTLLQHLSGWNFGIDQLLMREPPGELATASPNRMGPPASICFLLA